MNNTEGYVLVVDDSEIVRESLTDILSILSVPTLTAADGREGLQVFRQNQSQIGLIILDRFMPNMGGKEALVHLRSLSANVPIILSSAFVDKEASEYDLPVNGFLPKPYSLNDVASLLSFMRPA